MSRLPVYTDAPAGGDRVLLDTLGVIRGLRLSTTINGDWAASWQADLPARLDHRAFQPGRVVTVPVSPSQAWQGVLGSPQRGTPWQFTALGTAQLLDRWSAIDTTAAANALNLNEVVDEAIARGLSASRPSSLPSLPAGTTQSGTLTLAAALGQVTAQLNEWWNISRTGAITVAALPTALTYILQAQDTAGGRVIDGFVTDVTVTYQNAANYKITTLQRSNVAARSKYGRSEQFLDLAGQGPISTANAQTAGDNYLARNAPRLKFAGSFQATRGQLLNAGGATVDPATAMSGLLTRLLLTDPDTNAGELSTGALQLVIGQTDYDVDPDILTLTPVDYSPQGLAALVSGGSQGAGSSQAGLAYGSMVNLPANVPRGRVITASAASGAGVTTEVLIASGTATLVGGQRYEITGDIGNIWGSAVNGQAILHLRYASGVSVTTAATQLGNDKRVFGFTTQAVTGEGGTALADLVPPSDGQYTVGLFLLQGNTNASLTWNNALLTADSAGT